MGKKLTGRLHLLDWMTVRAAGDGDHNDGGRLFLRVRGESASWVFRFTSPTSAKRREMGLGVALRGSRDQAGATLAEARDKAHAARELLRNGIDPIDHRDGRRQQAQAQQQAAKVEDQRQRRTLGWCVRDYHRRAIDRKRTRKHAAQWIASLENHMPAGLWDKPVNEITAPEVLAALVAMQPHERARNLTDERDLSETVRRVRQRLEAVFEDARFHGWTTDNPAAAVRRKLREERPRATPGKLAALPYAEAPALMRRLREMPGTAARCLEFSLLTASRTSEALTARWAEVDIDARTWIVPAAKMKGGEAHFVPLSARAVEIVKAQRGFDLDLIFPSIQPGRAGKPQSNMAMLAVLGRLGVRERTTVHGLCRATFSTWCNESNAARPDVVEACLAHKEEDRVRAAYNRAEFAAERRALLDAWAEFLNTAEASPPR